MIVAISGLTATGKSTIARLLGKRLHLPVINLTFKTLAKEKGEDLLTLQKKAEENPEVDKSLDEAIKKKVAEVGSCVVSTWLGPWMLPADFRVWLFAPLEVRVKRVQHREGLDPESALEYVKMKDDGNRRRYEKFYGIDLEKRDHFDLEINTANFDEKSCVEIVLKGMEEKELL